ncbi:hypothetical protein PTHTG4_13170 [Parageobacillus thermoglucosidasius]|uniref:Uncharacterized protein n=1 Tax=Geobacillus sp. (strain Y4.1MC1) TaxID=581103 RepID=A0A7U3YEL3_GEOS0|nr:hypothetical protein Geoth_1600 [Parageobacillus thermoglucosidasius C56-YS93]GCD82255.1 hypothetical protein PTHTG4_13170 [Parageobacillus thermoglucosidasius]
MIVGLFLVLCFVTLPKTGKMFPHDFMQICGMEQRELLNLYLKNDHY